jgi:type II secretory pathway predicted ATPase ExeA
MYEAFFQLKHKPFSLLPDPDFLFLSSKHAIALSLLEYSLSGQAGFCVITGEIGSGKTTLVRAFLRRIGREFTVGLISNTHSSLRDMSTWALGAFGKKPTASSPAESYQELMAYLIAEYGEGRQCILIVDEAQNLSVEALEELRLLSNINSGKDLLLQIVLVGQPELLTKLKQPELCQFAQRIAVSHHLAPLPYADTRRYIEHRLKVAGTERNVFTEMAMGAVQYFSGGVPRLINSICDLSLVYAFADGVRTINEDLVFRVIADRQVSGIAPFARTEAADNPGVRDEIRGMAQAAGVLDEDPPVRVAAASPVETASQVGSEAATRQPLQVAAASPVETPSPVRSDLATAWNGQEREALPQTANRDLLFNAEEKDSPFEAVDRQLAMPVDAHLLASEKLHLQGGSLRDSEPTGQAGGRHPIRPTWGTPAAQLNSERWPSISDRSLRDSNDGIAGEAANATSAAPRSWWRRGFLRQS